MKLSCLQEDLLKGLKTVGRAVASRSTLPVLSNVLLTAQNDELKLSATNLEIGINCWIGAKVEEEGATTVPARTLTDWVNSLSPERVDMDLIDRTQTLKLKCGRQKANIKGISAEEFPLIPVIEEGFSLPADMLCGMIDRAHISAAKDESRPILTGILFQVKDGVLTLAAADGFRLSVCTAESPTIEKSSIIIPALGLKELARIAESKVAQVELRENQILFQANDVGLVSQLIAGNFPDYNVIIPKEHTTRTVVNVDEFNRACKTANIFAREDTGLIRLAIKQDSVVISATSAEYGDNTAEIDAVVEGEKLEIGINVGYLLDMLNVIDSEQVVIETTTPSAPLVFKPMGSVGWTHVIMPMHVHRILKM